MPGMPPPPPGGAAAPPPGKFKHNPKVPMKNVMWNMVPQNNIKDTIWSKIDDLKIPIDKEYLEKEYNKPAAAPAKAGPGGPVKVEAVKVNLLGPERSKNFELVLGKLKMGYDKIAEALITCDDKILTLTNLESLEIIAPTEEEVATIKGYDGDKTLLGNAEKFIDEISKVKGFLNRIKGIKFSKVNDELFADLEPKVGDLLETLKELPNDTRIKDVLEYALAVGNYLNGTTPRGGAWGFKFENLDKVPTDF
jgi:diaphanous 1